MTADLIPGERFSCLTVICDVVPANNYMTGPVL